ncbi:MAG: HAD-IA family hydrolase [Rhabdaerophilum sp.]
MRGTLVFDLDGTLAETAPDIMGTLNALLAGEGLNALPIGKARELVGAGARALIERGFKASGRPLSAEKLDELFAAFLPHYLGRVAQESFLFPGVEAALDRFAAEGYALAICTNKPEPHSLALLEALGIKNRFRAIIGRETLPFFKPDPRVLLETIRLSGGEPSRAIMIGDSKTDLDTARAAQIPSIGVSFGYTDVPMAELQPDRLIHHFDALDEAVESLLSA